jgi:hypothetical protein
MGKTLETKTSRISISNSVLRELILSRGWKVEPNAIGTVWHAIHKMTYDFVEHIQLKLPKHIDKLNKDNLSRKWKKKFIQVSEKVEWTEDVTIVIASIIYIVEDSQILPHMCDVRVKIKGANKSYSVDVNTAIDRYLNRELEKTLK